MANLLRIKRLDEISVVDKGASGNSNVNPAIVIVKRRTIMDKNWLSKAFGLLFTKQDGAGMTLEEAMSPLSDEAKAIILEAFKQAAMKQDNPEPTDPEKNDPMPTDPEKNEDLAKILKAMPEAVAKQLKAGIEAQKRADDLEKRLAAIESDRELDQYIEKAKKMAYLAGKSTTEIAKAIRAIQKSGDADSKVVMELLEKANKAIEASDIFKNVGSGSRVHNDGVTAFEEAAGRVRDMVSKSSDLSEEKALFEVFKRDPELHRRYREEQRLLQESN